MDDFFRHKTVIYSSSQIMKLISERRLITEPDFKDPRNWNTLQKSSFIESMLLNIPLQPIWCEESLSGEYHVIDGTQRLNTVYSFCHNEFRLKGLRIHEKYDGLNFKELPYHEVLSILDRVTFTFLVLNFDTPLELKSEFYWRLMESDKKHKSQAARNFGYRNTGYLLRQIESQLSHNLSFQFARYRENIHSQESKKNEFILCCLLVLAISTDCINFDLGNTIESTLDALTIELENSPPYARILATQLFSATDLLRSHYGHKINILLNNIPYISNDLDFTANEFYQLIIRASMNKVGWVPVNLKAIKINPGIPINNLISDVEEIKYA